MYNIKEKVKGITLVSLVVTIIVLLILAGVAINFTLGEDGILTRAGDAASKYEEASIEEIIELYKLNGLMGGEETLKEYLVNNGIISQEEVEEEGLIKLSNNIYGISTFEDLKSLSESVNKGEEYKGKKIYVLNDIDCGAEFNEETGELFRGENFIPIGTSNSSIENEGNSGSEKKEFNGKLDGMGYKIEKIYIKKNEEGSYCTGLIGYLGEEGEIRDLSITNSYIQGNIETGAIVGRSRGKIINCTNESNIRGEQLTGGIAGRNTNLIDNCINRGNIIGGIRQTGGIVANCDFGDNAVVSNCENYGNIDSNIQSDSLGGIVGGAYVTDENNHMEISNCYNKGKIGNLNINLDSVGGIVGRARDYKEMVYNNIIVTNCINEGQVNGYNGVGGIAGYLQNSHIEKTKNTGNVNGSYSLIGGITGINQNGIVSMSFNSGYIFLSEGGFYGVGGISGNCHSTTGVARIEECYNSGEVYDLSNMTNGRQTAGIVGNITSSDYQSEIINCYNTGYIHGIGYIGGIASGGNGYKIVNCYNIGKLYSDGGNTGGIICNINEEGNNQCINNYWLDTCGASYGIKTGSSNEGAESKPEDELKALANTLSDKYTNDVNNINNGFPILKWQLE